jgi:hypothetical protein
MRMTFNSERGGTILLILIFSLVILGGSSSAAGKSANFDWDKDLSIQIDHVDIKAHSISEAWQQITKKYLIRINFYEDRPERQEKVFVFNKDKVTGREILDALLREYTEFTYTQNPDTGIIWIHPKKLAYGELLNQRVKISHDAIGVPMYPDIYLPLSKLLGPDFIDSTSGRSGRPPSHSWFYDVDVIAGIYSAREILDLCCSANPTKVFWIVQPGQTEAHTIYPTHLAYPSPVAPPRVGALRFWELGIGKSTNAIPTYKQIREAMASRDPAKRLTASLYFEACDDNYSTKNLLEKAEGADQTIWSALGVQYAIWRSEETNFFSIMISSIPRIGEDLKNIKDPCLAVLVSLQLTRESKDTSYVDQIVSHHSFTEEEINSIKPEMIRTARSSNAVREKIQSMHLTGSEFSPDALRELENTNFLEVVPNAPK